MIYGELGIIPIKVDITSKMISYWVNLVDDIHKNYANLDLAKLASRVYYLLQDLHYKNKIKSPWIEHVKTSLCSSGFSGVWYSQSFINRKWIVKSFTQKQKDLFVQSWISDVERSSNNNIYKYIKGHFEQSIYVKELPSGLCKTFIRFITRNHRLPIETGRWSSIPVNE